MANAAITNNQEDFAKPDSATFDGTIPKTTQENSSIKPTTYSSKDSLTQNTTATAEVARKCIPLSSRGTSDGNCQMTPPRMRANTMSR